MQIRVPRRSRLPSAGHLAAAVLCACIAGHTSSVAAQAGGSQIEVVRGTRKGSVQIDGEQRIERDSDRAAASNDRLDPNDVEIEIDADRYALDGNQRAEIRQDLRTLIGLYDRYLGIQVSPDFRVDLEVMGNRRDYEARYGGRQRTAGFYRHDSREAVVSGTSDRDQTRRTMIHEASHAILGSQYPGAPRWLNEGLATYFESLQRTGGRIRVPRDEELRRQVRDELAGSAGRILDRLVSLDPKDWNDQDERQFRLSYAQAWSVVYMLMDTPDQRAILVRLLDPSAGSSASAIEREYPRGLRGFAADWRRWLNSGGIAHTYY